MWWFFTRVCFIGEGQRQSHSFYHKIQYNIFVGWLISIRMPWLTNVWAGFFISIPPARYATLFLWDKQPDLLIPKLCDITTEPTSHVCTGQKDSCSLIFHWAAFSLDYSTHSLRHNWCVTAVILSRLAFIFIFSPTSCIDDKRLSTGFSGKFCCSNLSFLKLETKMWFSFYFHSGFSYVWFLSPVFLLKFTRSTKWDELKSCLRE